MSTLSVIALALVALAVALVIWLLRRRAAADAASPRTVADLVRLRAERAGATEQAEQAPTVTAEPGTTPVPVADEPLA
ncbi:MAG: hypothetical protein QOG20_5125, partial [Pseudonocardiales bacterium]|nr:hypothetical protein [Pseudonocardiales bacterium]